MSAHFQCARSLAEVVEVLSFTFLDSHIVEHQSPVLHLGGAWSGIGMTRNSSWHEVDMLLVVFPDVYRERE